MSRSNLKIVRDIREDEALQVRKKILKAAPGSAYSSQQKKEQSSIMSDIFDAGEAYLEKLNALERFTKKAKKQVKEQTHKTEWLRESDTLKTLATRLENSITESLGSFMARSPGESFLIQDSLQEQAQLSDSLGVYQRDAYCQLQDVKSLLKDVARQRGSAASLVGGSPREKSSQATNGVDEAISIVAELFLGIRNSMIDTASELKDEECRLMTDIGQLRKAISGSIAAYDRGVSDGAAAEQLQLQDNDPIDVRLLREEWMTKLEQFDASMNAELSKLTQQWTGYCDEHEIDSNDSYGSWSPEDHATFAKNYTLFLSSGMARGKLATVLEAELTSKSPIEISVHEDWFRQRRLYYKKRKDVLATCSTTERNALIEKAREELDACRQRARDAEAREREEAEREAHRERVHQRLMEQRLLKQHADQEALSSELARLHEQQAVEDAKLRAQEAERARKKELVREYLQQRAQLEEERRVRAAEGRQREESERKERVDSERPNVERRGQLYEQKIKARKQREAEFEREQERALQLLLQLATNVPYYEKIQNIDSRLDHITEATKMQEYHRPATPTRGHIAMRGFADKALFKDARFRLGLALRAAGVHQSEVARQVIAALHPRAQAPF